MIEMTLSSRHRIRKSSPGGLRSSTLPLGHGGSPQYWLSHVDGEETFLFLSNRRVREPNPELWRESQRETRHYHGYCADIFSCINKNLRYFTYQHINPASVAPQYLLFYISLAQDQVISCLKILGSINLFIEIIGLLRPTLSRLNGHTS